VTRRFAAAAVLVLASGCTTLPPAPEIADWSARRAALQALPAWTLNGRIAVAAGENGFSGGFDWAQDGESADIALSGPMGGARLRIHVEGGALEVTDDRGNCYTGEEAERFVAERIGPRTRAVMFVGMGGNPGQYEKVRALCAERGLALILDAAHMSGTWMADGTHAGADADASVFSFQAVKNLPTADSGMLCFAERRLDDEVRKWTWLGINKDTYTGDEEAATGYSYAPWRGYFESLESCDLHTFVVK